MSFFIYVFSQEDYDALIADGYAPVMCEPERGLYIIENKVNPTFNLASIRHVMSDMLSF